MVIRNPAAGVLSHVTVSNLVDGACYELGRKDSDLPSNLENRN